MMLIAIMRVGGGIALLIKGNQLDTGTPITATNNQIVIVGIGLLIISLVLFIAAINLIKHYSYKGWLFCWFTLGLFFLDGLLNGFLLFGQPLERGQSINIIAIIIIGILLLIGKSSLKLSKT